MNFELSPRFVSFTAVHIRDGARSANPSKLATNSSVDPSPKITRSIDITE